MMKRGLKHDFTLVAILLIPIGVAVNVVIGQLVQILKIPLYLDVIGTMITAMVAGPWVGAVVGLANNLILSIFQPTILPFALVSIAIGLTVGYLSKKKMLTTIGRTIVTGVIITLIAVVMSSVISVFLYGGATGTSSDTITALLLASGQEIWTAVFTKNIIVESVDKIVSILIAYFIVRSMSDRYLSKLNYGSPYIKKK
ncbi:MAG: ECF transporter S component [Novibacillus thermophilus]